MANIKSQKKRIRTNEKARIRNRAVRSELKTLIKNVQAAVEEGNAEAAKTAAARAYKRLDQAAAKRIVKGLNYDVLRISVTAFACTPS